MRRRISISLVFISLLFSACAQAEDIPPPELKSAPIMENFLQIKGMVKDIICPNEKYEAMQSELKNINETDRSDRQPPHPDMTTNDIERRVRVAAIGAQGCLKDKEDYWTASLVFQHGTLPEHYFQALLYANKSVDLGHENGMLREAIIDRYLMSLGKKQIFASQITAPVAYKMNESEADHIPCIWPIETQIDLLNEYNYRTHAYRQKRQAEIQAMTSSMPVCNFPALSSKDDLAALLSLKI